MTKKLMAKIIKGSKATFSIFLTDEDGKPFSLAPFTNGGSLSFVNCAGTYTEVDLSSVIPGSHPDAGEIAVEISSEDTENADKKWASADLVLVDEDDDETVILLDNKFEVSLRNAPEPV